MRRGLENGIGSCERRTKILEKFIRRLDLHSLLALELRRCKLEADGIFKELVLESDGHALLHDGGYSQEKHLLYLSKRETELRKKLRNYFPPVREKKRPPIQSRDYDWTSRFDKEFRDAMRQHQILYRDVDMKIKSLSKSIGNLGKDFLPPQVQRKRWRLSRCLDELQKLGDILEVLKIRIGRELRRCSDTRRSLHEQREYEGDLQKGRGLREIAEHELRTKFHSLEQQSLDTFGKLRGPFALAVDESVVLDEILRPSYSRGSSVTGSSRRPSAAGLGQRWGSGSSFVYPYEEFLDNLESVKLPRPAPYFKTFEVQHHSWVS